jgi:hypothetical protein
MSAEKVVVVEDGVLRPEVTEGGEPAPASPAAYLRAWAAPGAYTAGRTCGRNVVAQWYSTLSPGS